MARGHGGQQSWQRSAARARCHVGVRAPHGVTAAAEGKRRVCVELRKVTAGTRRDTGLLIASASPARSGPAGLARDPR
jgi:hypothetical protein